MLPKRNIIKWVWKIALIFFQHRTDEKSPVDKTLECGHLKVQQAKLLQNGNVKCFVENSPKTTVANVNKKRWQLALVAPVNKTVPAADNFCCLLMLIFFFLFCRVTTNANCQGRSAERNICHVNMVQRKEKKNCVKKGTLFRPGRRSSLFKSN